jgi:two-component system, NarL family, nitrate/nitrite response regulator NarL
MNEPCVSEQVVRLMLVDDHPLVRDGLRARLSTVPGFLVVAEAEDASTALALAEREAPDLLLMDIGLPGVNGIDLTRQLLASRPELRVVMLTMHDAPAMQRAAREAGACAFLLKDGPSALIVDTIHAVMRGQKLFPAPRAVTLGPAPGTQEPHLTPRERDVLALIAEGLSSRDIGERLGMGVRTVETHRTHLRRKLQLNSAAALVRYAIQHHGR